jgi:hypothetical protein
MQQYKTYIEHGSSKKEKRKRFTELIELNPQERRSKMKNKHLSRCLLVRLCRTARMYKPGGWRSVAAKVSEAWTGWSAHKGSSQNLRGKCEPGGQTHAHTQWRRRDGGGVGTNSGNTCWRRSSPISCAFTITPGLLPSHRSGTGKERLPEQLT